MTDITSDCGLKNHGFAVCVLLWGMFPIVCSASTGTNMGGLIAAVDMDGVHRAGKGTAYVEVSDVLGYRQNIFEFAFSGENTRSDRFELGENGKPGRREVTCVGGAESWRFSGRSVEVEDRPILLFYRVPGYDFNVATYASPIKTLSLHEYLSRIRENARTLTIEDCNDVVTLKATFKGKLSTQSVELTLNKSMGLLPRRYLMRRTSSQKAVLDSDEEILYQWKRWGQKYYLQNLERTAHGHRVTDDGNLEPVRHTTKVEILDFVPEAQIDEFVFRVDGLDLPDDARVYDRGTRKILSYKEYKEEKAAGVSGEDTGR